LARRRSGDRQAELRSRPRPHRDRHHRGARDDVGLLLITGRFLRLAVYLLFGQLIGILAPLALFTGRLFAGPHNAPTIEGQYVIKDLIIVAAGFVVASTLPGIVPGADPAPSARPASSARSGWARTDWTDRSAVRG
jgi:hypothetical protein